MAQLRSEGRRVESVVCDLTAEGAIASLAERVEAAGGLTGLVHAAGLSPTMGDARRIFEVNLFATARLVDALEDHLRPGAVGVLIASQAAQMIASGLTADQAAALEAPFASDTPDAYERLVRVCGALGENPSGAYGLSKRGVQLLAISRAPAWGARGARLLSISPGMIDTEMGSDEFEAHTEAMQSILDRTPVEARLGRAEEIAAVADFLMSDAASFMSGSDLLVDGGSTNQVLRGPASR
jgi:NAD(P)-dependent dehydrogenase (short-subunit alcohol dehydrogenase family)